MKTWKNIFLIFFSKDNSFSRCVQETPRYKRSEKILSEEGTVLHLSSVVYFAIDVETILKKFQTVCPLLHILYTEMQNLLWTSMGKFIRSKNLYNLQNGNKTKVFAAEILLIDVNDKKNSNTRNLLTQAQKQKACWLCQMYLICVKTKRDFD